MKLINQFNCPKCLWGVVNVFKVNEFREGVRYCMNAIYEASCDCVIKGNNNEKSSSQEVAQDVQSTVGQEGRSREEPLAQI